MQTNLKNLVLQSCIIAVTQEIKRNFAKSTSSHRVFSASSAKLAHFEMHVNSPGEKLGGSLEASAHAVRWCHWSCEPTSPHWCYFTILPPSKDTLPVLFWRRITLKLRRDPAEAVSPDGHWGLGQNTKTAVSGLTRPTCFDRVACLQTNLVFVRVCSGITTPGSLRLLPGPRDVSVIFMKLSRPFGECSWGRARKSLRLLQSHLFFVSAVANAFQNTRQKKKGEINNKGRTVNKQHVPPPALPFKLPWHNNS